MENQKHFLVSADAVPPVFSKVLKAKELLATNQAKDVTEAFIINIIEKFKDFLLLPMVEKLL